MRRLTGATLVLASGKGLENYLGKLRDNLTAGQILLEVGNSIPSMEMSEAAQLMEAAAHGHPGHTHGGVDPHWWNSVENVIRAARVITAAFTKADPGNAPFYEANNRAYQKQLTDLRKWALREIGRIPSKDRKLATAHLSMGYFARDFGFKLIPVQGLNPAVPATSQELAAAIDTIRKSKIRAVFPEQGVNPKHLAQMSAETGVRFGGQLIADGNGTGDLASFSEAFAHNVMTITKELAPAP
jgi:zinc/manganese transport system substrate-binding protein